MQSNTYIVGRRAASRCAGKPVLRINDRSVSLVHAELSVLGDRVMLKDMGSLRGTWRVDSKGRRRIANTMVGLDETVAFGESEHRVRDLIEAGATR